MSSQQVTEIASLLSGRRERVSDGGKPSTPNAAPANEPRTGTSGKAGAADTAPPARATSGREERSPVSNGDASDDDGDDGAGSAGVRDGDGEHGAGDGAQDEPGTEGEGAVDSEPGYTLKELAARLEVPIRSLYELDIPMGEGESMSLGELKDLAKTARSANEELTTIKTGLEDRENELLVRRNEVTTLMRAMGGQVPPEAARQMQAMQAQHLANERQALASAIPAWQNSATFENDKKSMLEFVGRYGFGQRDLESISDHRFLKLLNDVSRGWKSSQAALQAKPAQTAGVKSAPGGRRSPSSETLRATMERAHKPDASKADKLAGISALLGNR